MKITVTLIFAFSLQCLSANGFDPRDWLLWHQAEVSLPYNSKLTTYPPVNLDLIGNELRGAIAVPYDFAENKNRLLSELLIVIIDGSGKSHFLKPKTESIGYFDSHGIAMASLAATQFTDGGILVQFYRANTLKNRNALQQRKAQRRKETDAIKSAAKELKLAKPNLNKAWVFDATTLDGSEVSLIIEKSDWTVFQLYSANCGFCRKSIPTLNTIDSRKNISVIGLAGFRTTNDALEHTKANKITYPFVNFEGDLAEQALLHALDQTATPT
ncbi:MAG: hypothetical protein V2I33_01710, partial [Kangiellaceae bacterium]|nr:hypothetical protein [Kangiellaceae bacterium]